MSDRYDAVPPPLPSRPQPVPPPRRGGFGRFLRGLGRGINITRLVIVNTIFFGLLAAILLVVFLGSRANLVDEGTVLVLAPEGSLVEQYSADPLSRAIGRMSGDGVKQVQVRDLVRAIDSAAKDQRITRIVLRPDRLQPGGFAALREVGAALDRFRKAGKPVLVWANSLEQGQYYLAAHADKVYIDPQGGVMATGLANYRLFYKDLLDRLGVQVHLFRVGQFKSAAEPFILDHASPESKEADAFWLGGLWTTWIDEVARMRGIDPAALRADVDELAERVRDAKGSLAQLAVEEKLADGIATEQQFVQMLRKEGVPAGKKDQSFRQIDLAGYLADRGLSQADMLQTGPGVTVVVAEGEITGGKQAQGTIGGESTAALIRSVRKDRRTRALVLRVNSPGGEVYAAEQIRREVELTREAGIPVVVSMGDVAASGGYWISMNANRIYAEPNTITGSIGIFGMFFTVPDTLAKIGVKSDGVSTGSLAGAFDMTRPLDPNVGVLIQSIIDKGYRDFVGNVAKARGKDYAAIDAIAQGRVWTGQQAMERGLVDRMGSLDDAIRDAATEAGMGKDFNVRYAEKPMGAFERFLTSVGDSSEARVAMSWGLRLPSWVAELPKLAPEWSLFRNAEAGKPHVYAYCFCSPH
ncbi:signal peptide peptidase SppA [Luteibacter sp. UNCMF366Tsu5.1]|uniref:signal peptide peptidase SppA n=1 Tax=Luteibacter sp. UNCMF366Tsu5.1 TaxID=1502758 RepID=UPI000908AD87|nr:signal peptide peptidase SppA [Luteibacter sp. UNCMF366Tsu5.1]SFW52978.1 protease-4 [Luteibacter sp. UNCMF366Tsu5.1]